MNDKKKVTKTPIFSRNQSGFKGKGKRESVTYTISNPKVTKPLLNVYHTIYIGLLLLVIYFQLKPLFVSTFEELPVQNLLVTALCLYLIVRALIFNRKFHRDADRVQAEEIKMTHEKEEIQ